MDVDDLAPLGQIPNLAGVGYSVGSGSERLQCVFIVYERDATVRRTKCLWQMYREQM